ncbi:MAG: hypothetical protein IPJ31_10000 [Bacteroidetes bacterium]|nr:hypothetical protein [Bacteroidota bacterium]
MLAKRIGKVAFYGILFIVVILSATGFLMSQIAYDSLITYVLQSLHRNDLYEVLTKKYFTREKFALLKMLSWGVSACSLILLLVFFQYRSKLIKGLQQSAETVFSLIRKFRTAVCNNSKLVNRLLFVSLLLVLVRSIYYASTFYIQYDEAWNYNYFLQNTIFYSGLAYNNYPLHNVISWFFIKLLTPSTFVLRLPSIIAGILTCLLVFVTIKKLISQ